jgi:hypothetical protein
MKVSEHQISSLIKTYLKNNRERLANAPFSSEAQAADDEVHISDEGKKILLERMHKQIMERARKESSLDIQQ